MGPSHEQYSVVATSLGAQSYGPKRTLGSAHESVPHTLPSVSVWKKAKFLLIFVVYFRMMVSGMHDDADDEFVKMFQFFASMISWWSYLHASDL